MKRLIVVALIVFLFTSCASFMAGMRGAHPKKYIEEHPNLNSSIKECILNNQVKIGMSEEEVKASWGNPDRTHRSVGSWGVHEQWVYRRGDYSSQYLYFENGILTSFSN